MNWKNFFRRVWSWLIPRPGWEDRVLAYRSGNTVWPVPEHPDMDPLFPWPAEWCVWEVAPPAKEGGKHFPKMISCTSCVSGTHADGDNAVRCARCGIPLHMGEAHMATNLDIPSCSWCVGSVRRVR